MEINPMNILTFIPSPQVVVHQDNYAFPSSIVLDENNYSLWSQLRKCDLGLITRLDTLSEIHHDLYKVTQDWKYGSPRTTESKIGSSTPWIHLWCRGSSFSRQPRTFGTLSSKSSMMTLIRPTSSNWINDHSIPDKMVIHYPLIIQNWWPSSKKLMTEVHPKQESSMTSFTSTQSWHAFKSIFFSLDSTPSLNNFEVRSYMSIQNWTLKGAYVVVWREQH